MRAFRPRDEHPALYAISTEAIAALCQVHVTTARRWKRGEEPPYAALRLIEILTTGQLELVDPKWSGWSLKSGKLVSPTGTEFSTGEIQAIPFVQQLVASYQADQRFIAQADWVDERWVPGHELTQAVIA